MIIVLAALQLTSNDVHSEFKRRSARVLRRAAPGAVTFGVATTEGGTMQTMQFNERQTGFDSIVAGINGQREKGNGATSTSDGSTGSFQESEEEKKGRGSPLV